MFNICIFSTRYSFTWMEKVHQLNLADVSYHFFIYESLRELEELFIKHAKQYDGVVFSGQIPYLHIHRTLPVEAVSLPTTFFDISQRDFYYKIAEVQYKDPQFSFKDSIIDFIYEENSYLDLKNWLPEEDFPYVLSNTIEIFGHEQAYEVVSKRHLALWKENKVRYSFTRLTNLYKYLEADNITPILVMPSEKSMLSTLHKLIKEIELLQLTNSQVVTGHVIFFSSQNDVNEIEYRQIALYKAILDYKRQQGISIITYKSAIHYEIITNYIDLMKITNHLESCTLSDFLNKELPFKVKIGWGIGKTLDESRLQAEKAASFCNGNQTESFVLTKESQLIGPLDGQSQHIPIHHDERLDDIAAETNLSVFQLQKINNVLHKLKTDSITAEDLAAHLSISSRTASRILKRLEETGYATILQNLVAKAKGRPPKLYKIEL